MAAPIRFLSGRQQQQKIGIEGSTEDKKVLEVVGRTGIGTTSFEPAKILDVRGDAIVEGTTTVGKLEITGTGDVPASLTVETANITGVSTFGGAVDVNAGLDVDGQADLDEVVVAGVATFSSAVDINSTLDVDGDTQLDDLTVAGVATFSSAINATDIIKGYEYTAAPSGSTVTLAVTVASKDATHRYNGTGSGNGYVIDGIQAPFLTLTPGRTYRFTNDNTGSHPFRFYLEADRSTLYSSGVDFQDTYTEITISDTTPEILHYQCSSHAYMGNAVQTNSNTVVVSTASTFSSAVDINSTLDVDGDTQLDDLTVAGVATFQGAVNFDVNSEVNIGTGVTILGDNLHVTGIVSALQFIGDGSGITNLPGISTQGSSNLTDVNVSGTTTTSQFRVSGIGTAERFVVSTGGLDVDGQTDLDELIVSGVSTFQGNIVAATAEFSGNVTIGGTLIVEDKTNVDSIGLVTARTGVRVLAGGIDVTAGISTFGALVDVNNRLDVVGGANIDQVNATGISSFTELDVSTGGLDVDGQTDLDELQVAGVSTFSAKAVFNTAYPSIDADNEIQVGTAIQLGKAGVITATSFSGDGSNLTGIGTQGPDGSFRGITVAGISTFNDDVRITAGGLDVTGVVTATSFSGNATSATTATNVTVADESSDTTCNVLFTTGATGDLAPKSGTNLTFNSSNGTLTATEFSGGGTGITGITASQVGALADIVSDTSPQLGGDLDVNGNDINGSGNIDLTGNINATGNIDATGDIGAAGIITATGMVLVAGSGLDVGAVGVLTALSLDISTGGIDVDGQSNLDEVAIAGVTTFSALADVNNRLDVVGGANIDQVNVTGIASFKQLDVSTGGLDVDGQTDLDELVVAGIATFQTHVELGDSDELRIGDGDDLQLYHNGSHSFISNTTGTLNIITTSTGGDISLKSNGDVNINLNNGAETAATFTANGAVSLYHDNTKKFETTSSGAIITGVLTATSYDIELNDLSDVTTSSTSLLLGDSVSTNSTENTVIGQEAGANINARKNTFVGYQAGKFVGNEENVAIGNQALGGATGSVQSSVARNIAIGDRAAAQIQGSAINNTVVGTWAGYELTTGSHNTLLGYSAGYELTTGDMNVLLGYRAGAAITTSDDAIAIGGYALDAATSVPGTVAIGYQAGSDITTGGYNTLVGMYAGVELTTGRDNCAYGFNSLYENITGSYNVAVGYDALYNALGDSNVAIGYDAGDVITTGENNICIGYQADASSATASNEITLGNSGITTFRIPGIGVTFGEGGADISGIVTAVSFSGDGSNLTGIAATDHVSTFDLVVAGISTFNNDVNFIGNSANIVFDKSADALEFADDAKAVFGTGDDLQIYHNNHSYIDQTGSNNLHIRNTVDDQDITIQTDDGSGGTATYFQAEGASGRASMHFYGDRKLYTNTGGVDVTGGVNATGVVTATQLDISTGGLDVDGETQLDELVVAGVSTFSNDVTFTGNSYNAVWDKSADALEFADDAKAVFGTGDDLKIYHDSANSFISQEGDGDLTIRNLNDDNDVIIQSDDGSGGTANYFRAQGGTGEAKLYHYGNEKLTTASGGVTVDGTLTATTFSGSGASLNNVDAATLDGVDSTSFLRSDAADVKTSGDLRFNNNIGITFGGSDNSRIFHDGTDLSLDLTAYVTDFKIRDGTTERYTFTKSGELSLVDINASGIITATQLDVSTGGLDVDGQTDLDELVVAGVSTFNNNVIIPDDVYLRFGATNGSDLYISHIAGANTINAGANTLKVNCGIFSIKNDTDNEDIAKFTRNGSVELYYDNSKRFETTTDGVDFSGTGSIKVPVGTTAQRNSSPTAGDFRYNSDEGAFEGYTDSWGSIGGSGGATEVDTNVSSTSAVGVGSFATASFRSAEVIAQIVQIDEYQVGKYLMIHDGTTVTVIEQAAVATGDAMLGSFDGAINGSNAELRVNMVSSGIATVTTKISTVTI